MLASVATHVPVLGAEPPAHAQGEYTSPHLGAKSPLSHCQPASRLLVLWLEMERLLVSQLCQT